MGKLAGKIALVTGGNSGIGLETAKLYKAEGAQVIITARSADTFARTKAEYGTQFDVVQTDVSRLADITKLAEHVKTKYGRLDVLFANAGIAEFVPTSEVTEETFDRQFNTNVKGLYFTVAKLVALMPKGSAIVLNASVVASKGFPGSSVYSGTKAAVRNFARTWAAEFSALGVRVNVVSPGPIETPIWDKMGIEKKAAEDRLEQTRKSLPLGRVGRPEEIASVALFLATNESSFMTGSEVMVDGGEGQV